MMSIGGYFELEIREGKHFHQGVFTTDYYSIFYR